MSQPKRFIDDYLARNPLEKSVETSAAVNANIKQQKAFLENFNKTTVEWKQWVSQGAPVPVNPSQVLFLSEKFEKILSADSNANANMGAGVKELLSWPMFSPYLLNLGEPKDSSFFFQNTRVLLGPQGATEATRWELLNKIVQVQSNRVSNTADLGQVIDDWKNSTKLADMNIGDAFLQLEDVLDSTVDVMNKITELKGDFSRNKFTQMVKLQVFSLYFQKVKKLEELIRGAKIQGRHIASFNDAVNELSKAVDQLMQSPEFQQVAPGTMAPQQSMAPTASYGYTRYGGQYPYGAPAPSYGFQQGYTMPGTPNATRTNAFNAVKATLEMKTNNIEQTMGLLFAPLRIMEIQLQVVLYCAFWRNFCLDMNRLFTKQVPRSVSGWLKWNGETYWTMMMQRWMSVHLMVPNAMDWNKGSILGLAGDDWMKVFSERKVQVQGEQGMDWETLFAMGGILTVPLVYGNRKWELSDTEAPLKTWNMVVAAVEEKMKVTNIEGHDSLEISRDDYKWNKKIRFDLKLEAAPVSNLRQSFKELKRKIFNWVRDYTETGSNQQKQADVWKRFKPIVQEAGQLQLAWWKVTESMAIGSAELRTHWNLWWDFQRFYQQMVYAQSPEGLYNGYNYLFDLSNEKGQYSYESYIWMRQMMQKSKAHRAIFMNANVGKFFQDVAFFRPLVPLVKSNVNGDQVYQWETLPNPANPKAPLGDMVSTLDFVTLCNGLWLNPALWSTYAVSQGFIDQAGNDLKYVFMPVRVGKDDYWMMVNELWRMLNIPAEQRTLTGLLPGGQVAAGHKPLFYSWSKLVRAMGAPTKQKRTIAGTGWETVLSPQNVREFVVITFTQAGKQSAIPVLTETDAYKTVFSQMKNSAKTIQKLGYDYLVRWFGRILLGQDVPLTSDPSKVDLKTPLVQQQPSAQQGGIPIPFMPSWKENMEKTMNLVKQRLFETTTEWRTRDEELLKSVFWTLSEQSQLTDEKTMRGWLANQEKTGIIYFAEKKKSNKLNKKNNKNSKNSKQ